MAKVESLIGKYVHMKVQGIEYRVYFEERGNGIPLVCQHTAGSDGRQWRHLLNDDEVAAKYRVIVPDLPYHGKSLPPESIEWWKQDYKLSKSFFIDFHVAFSHALDLEKPVYIGCSMGGHLAVDLAFEKPDEFRAVIGVQAALHSPGVTIEWFHHPRISNDFRATAMLGMASQRSPEKYRRECSWEYSQSAPSVFPGDLCYYFLDHDLTGKAHKIDTSRISVYLLAGEYDPDTSHDVTQQLANQIKGSKFTPMMGVGHFGMVENFEVFKKYLMPVLDEIAKAKRK